MLKQKIIVVILAAGKGTRMQSKYPKVLHYLGGKTILDHVIHTAQAIAPKKIILVWNNKQKIKVSNPNNIPMEWIIQKNPQGTGQAILLAIKNIINHEDILVLYGDMPLVSIKSIKKLQYSKRKSQISLLTMTINNPSGYGRVLRTNGKVSGIIEENDSNDKQKKIKEIYSGIFIAQSQDLKRWLKKINNKNTNKEFYATDIISLAYDEHFNIKTIQPYNKEEILGINNKLQLSNVENIFQKKQINQLLNNGVILKDSSHFILRGTLKHGQNIQIDTAVIIEENVILGDDVKIGPGCIIKNSIIDSHTNIQAYTIIENSKIGKNCTIGPFAHIKDNTRLYKHVQIGNFVEIKDSTIKQKSKAKHLSYIGNAKLGSQVNFGAGSITCNYDGVNKFDTIIGNNVFVGANTKFIAPVKIINNTTIAAGTTVTKDVNITCLVCNKKEQIYKKNWKRPQKLHKK